MKHTPKTFNLKAFCGNCYKESKLSFEYDTEIIEVGSGSDKSLKINLPNGKWEIGECPKCGSVNLNKRF